MSNACTLVVGVDDFGGFDEEVLSLLHSGSLEALVQLDLHVALTHGASVSLLEQLGKDNNLSGGVARQESSQESSHEATS